MSLLSTYKEKWIRFANCYLREPLDHIVFTKKNKSYGAYQLRLLSNKVLFWSVFFSCITFCAAFIGTSIYIHSNDQLEEEDLQIVEYIAFDSSIPKLNIPKGDKNANSKTKDANKEENTPKEDKPTTENPADQKKNTTPTITDKPKDPDSSTASKADSTNTSALKGDSSGVDEKGGYSTGSEENAQPVGGKDEFARYVAQHIKYPEELKKDRIEGTVYISFLVDSTGTVTRTQVLRGLNKVLDAEVLRAVKAAPKWIPAKQAGRPTSQQFVIPFKIHAP